MTHGLTISLTNFGFYFAYTVWAVLSFLLLIAFSKQNYIALRRVLKYLLNTAVFFIAAMFITELALVVQPPIYSTKDESVLALNEWIRKHQATDMIIATAAIAILFLAVVNN